MMIRSPNQRAEPSQTNGNGVKECGWSEQGNKECSCNKPAAAVDHEKGVVIIPAASCRGKGPLPFGVLQTGTVLFIISLWTDSRAVF